MLLNILTGMHRQMTMWQQEQLGRKRSPNIGGKGIHFVVFIQVLLLAQAKQIAALPPASQK